MISSGELEHVVEQVNSKFEELFKKIAALEDQVAKNKQKDKKVK